MTTQHLPRPSHLPVSHLSNRHQPHADHRELGGGGAETARLLRRGHHSRVDTRLRRVPHVRARVRRHLR